MGILQKVKTALRISVEESDVDEELLDLIEECKRDLVPANVDPNNINEDDPLIAKAIKTYCKINFDSTAEDYERLVESYKGLKAQLSFDSRYRTYEVDRDEQA